MSDALGIFRRTVGYESPLTANAMFCLGKVKASLGSAKEAVQLMKGALQLEVSKDAFHLETVWELLTKIKDVHMEACSKLAPSEGEGSPPSTLAALQATYSQYLPLIGMARKRLGPEHEAKEMGTLAVFYKTAGEVCMLAQDYETGEGLMNESLRLLDRVPDFDCTSLIEGCKALLQIAKANKPKHQRQQAGPSS